MKIGIIQCGSLPDEMHDTTGDYDHLIPTLLSGQDFEFDLWDVREDEWPDSLEDADGWLITGSRHGVYEDLPWIPDLEDFIRAAVMASSPVVGICFGHQIVAQALGGKVEKFKGGWAVGRQIYDFNGVELPLIAWHQDQVVELPPGATVLASNDFCAYAAIIYGDRALTVQAHPEFGPDAAEGLAKYRPSTIPADQLDAAVKSVADPLANEIIADQIADFYRLPR